MRVLIGTQNSNKKHYFRPDATISCDASDRRRGNKLIRFPRIAFEILDPSTEYPDRGAKLRAYKACPTMYEIVLVSQFAPHVEVYYRDEEDETIWRYALYEEDQEVVLPSMDIHLAMRDIYKGIDFNEPLLWEDEGE